MSLKAQITGLRAVLHEIASVTEGVRWKEAKAANELANGALKASR